MHSSLLLIEVATAMKRINAENGGRTDCLQGMAFSLLQVPFDSAAVKTTADEDSTF
jgi:hypothetical protein